MNLVLGRVLRARAFQPNGVRNFIEDDMLTESGFRESLAEERICKEAADCCALYLTVGVPHGVA